MLKLKTILAPVDFSERSTRAAQHTAVLARHFKSRVVLAHVVPLSPMEYVGFEGYAYTSSSWPSERDLRANAENRITALAEKLGSEHPVATVVLSGDPAREIDCLSQKLKADLIVIPTHGYGPFRRFLLGSVTGKVLHDVTCPVFTGAHIPEVTTFNQEPYKRMGCALDLGPHSEAVLAWAWDFARAYEEDLTIIHAAPLLEPTGVHSDWLPPGVRQAVIDAAAAKIDKLMKNAGCKAHVFIESADPAVYVRQVANSQYIDAMVIGRSPDKGLLGRLHTHAHALIRETPCPVISI